MWVGQGEQSGCSLKARLSDELCKPEGPSSGPKATEELIPSFILEQLHSQVLYSLQSLVGNSPALEVKDVGKRWIKCLAASHYYGKVSPDHCWEEESPGMEEYALWRLHSHPTRCVCVCVCVCAHTHILVCVRVCACARVRTCAYMYARVRTGLGYRRRQWHPTPVLLPGKFHGQRSLVGCSPWGR